MASGGRTPNFVWARALSYDPARIYKLNPEDLTVIDSFMYPSGYTFAGGYGSKLSAGGPDGSLYTVVTQGGNTFITRISPNFNVTTYYYIGGTGTASWPALMSNDTYLWAVRPNSSTVSRWTIDGTTPWYLSNVDTTASGLSVAGVRCGIYIEENDIIVVGGQNTSGTGDRLALLATVSTAPNYSDQRDSDISTQGGWLKGDYIPQVNQIFLNNQYNGDHYVTLPVNSNGTFGALNQRYTTNNYQYGGAVYLSDVRSRDGATPKQGYGIGFSYYMAAGNPGVVFDSNGAVVRTFSYQTYNNSLTFGAFNDGTIDSCANPASQIFYSSSHIGFGQGTHVVAWKIDPDINGLPYLLAHTEQGGTGSSDWQPEVGYREIGICHSSPDSHRQIYTPI